ncbi:hypothetical protein RRG08_043158 [Elysia crispata]|uniref:Uncharacterized protein n=1 Tax=Elysia crispata TaxID=231223 RepID=A0AAE1AR73_9GAST|nr:hypothetical protein RRG08_043158 [Elysia crispata]
MIVPYRSKDALIFMKDNISTPQPVPAYQQPVAPGGYYPPPQGQPPVGYYPPPQGQQPAGLGGGLLNNFLQIATAPLRIFSGGLGGRK